MTLKDEEAYVEDQIKAYWQRYKRPILIGVAVLLLLLIGIKAFAGTATITWTNPTQYTSPPAARSTYAPTGRATPEPTSSTGIQPIAMYSVFVTYLGRSRSDDRNAMPTAATAQTAPSTVQPYALRNSTSTMGVVVPAMRTNTDA